MERRRDVYLLKGYLRVGKIDVGISALVNSGADIVLLNHNLVKKYNLPTERLVHPLHIRNSDGSPHKEFITHRILGTLICRGQKLPTYWYVAELGHEDALLGTPWFRDYNPKIDWTNGRLTIDPKDIKFQQGKYRYRVKHRPPAGTNWGCPVPQDKEEEERLVDTVTQENIPEEDDLTQHPSRALNLLYQIRQEKKVRSTKSNFATEIAIKAHKEDRKKTLEEMVPPWLMEYRVVFDKKAADRYPPSREWDHAIDLMPDFKWNDPK